jgi:hypothetical protein
VYIRNEGKENVMKITHRSDKGKGGHVLISVPADRVAEIAAALAFLEAKRQQRGSQVVTALIVRAAKRSGWQHDSISALSCSPTPPQPQPHYP